MKQLHQVKNSTEIFTSMDRPITKNQKFVIDMIYMHKIGAVQMNDFYFLSKEFRIGHSWEVVILHSLTNC